LPHPGRTSIVALISDLEIPLQFPNAYPPYLPEGGSPMLDRARMLLHPPRRVTTACWAIAVLAVGLIAAPRAFAQSREMTITPQIGWQWGGTVNYTDPYGYYAVGSIHANAALSYGGALTVAIRPGYWGQIDYMYQGTDLMVRPSVGQSFKLCNLGTHYIQLSGLRALRPPGEKATPYVIGGMGMTIFSPGSSDLAAPYNGTLNSQYLFSISVGGGAMVDINPKVALRLQARFLMPIQWTSGSVYFGTGGSGLAVSGGSAIAQGDASLGLTFKLGQSR
jgi:hypothetical protein